MKDSQLRMIRAAFIVLLLFAGLPLAQAQQQAVENPVIAGDYPDPSVIRVGKDYYATATSGEWAPEFPILHSRDLVNWEVVGAVFQKRPAWTQGNFWAPEIAHDRGRYFVYYTARKKGGPLCVAVASAEKAAGPYTDHGPLVCQEIGSIDAVAATDENGNRYLIWKEDGNSREKPTPLWAQRLSEDGTKLVGDKKELFRNDPRSWEGGVVEGAFVLKRGDWFYLFYSGNACCGRRCNYALGVARSRKLLGPWEKNPANPILAENQLWQCPGHGSIVTDEQGRDLLLYHAYRQGEEAFYIGREALLDEIKWDGPDGWPTINAGKGPGARPPVRAVARNASASRNSFFDDFNAPQLKPGWQWPQANEPLIRIEPDRGGRLTLSPASGQAKDPISAVLSQPTTSADYVAATLIDLSMKPGTLAGLSAYNGRSDALGVIAGDGKIQIYKREAKRHQIVTSVNAPAARFLHLRMAVKDGYSYSFAYSIDGQNWKEIGEPVNGSYLEGIRIALTVGGAEGASGKFDWLRVTPNP